MPQGVRVVIEIDGKHHYSDATGIADVQRYAQMVRADRELKLAGYEVFRFGAAELKLPAAKAEVRDISRRFSNASAFQWADKPGPWG